MEANKELDDIIKQFAEQRLSVMMNRFGAFVSKYPELNLGEPLDGIRSDYDRMADYWATGYRDPQLEWIYNSLTRRLYSLVAEAYVRYDIGHSSYTSSVRRRIDGAGRDWSLP
ncbi:MAG: hypothetical protein Q4E71_10250, partial [Prevotella sp.]|nr:hypothetical protein [Prevotella sp.]